MGSGVIICLAILSLPEILNTSKPAPKPESKEETTPRPMKTARPPGEQLREIHRTIADNVEAHRVQREQMEEEWEEYKKEEAKRLAKEAEHAAWLESRKEWIENFPYKPTYHPTYTFDDPSLVGQALRERLQAEEKEIERLQFKMDNASTTEAEEAAWEELNAFEDELERREKTLKPKLILIEHHGFLRRFYENELRFTKEFEQVYRIAVEEGIDHPIAIAKAFDLLHDYHVKGRKDATIARVLMHSADLPSEFDTVPPLTMDQAERCRDRLIAEVPPEGFFKISRTAFCYVQKYEDELKPGDPILVR